MEETEEKYQEQVKRSPENIGKCIIGRLYVVKFLK